MLSRQLGCHVTCSIVSPLDEGWRVGAVEQRRGLGAAQDVTARRGQQLALVKRLSCGLVLACEVWHDALVAVSVESEARKSSLDESHVCAHMHVVRVCGSYTR